MPIRICDAGGPVLAKMLGESDVEGVSGCRDAYDEEYRARRNDTTAGACI
jgi:hypothetical protein